MTTSLQSAFFDYHLFGKPTLPDAEYDTMKHANGDKVFDTPLRTFEPVAFTPVRHMVPMLSLANVFDEQGITDWYNNVIAKVGPDTHFAVECKFDGLAISLHYYDGVLGTAVTRGDGEVGEDVTANVKTIRSVPLRLKRIHGQTPIHHLEVRGEVYMTRADFLALNKASAANGGRIYANERNAAAGSLRVKDPKVTARRKLTFSCYGVGAMTDLDDVNDYQTLRAYLEGVGIPFDRAFSCYRQTLPELLEAYRELMVRRDQLPFGIDGMVIKVLDFGKQDQLGWTSRTPNWAIACKFPAEKAETVIEAVDVQVGRTGVLTPVARITPTQICGVTVSNVTLHNFDEIKRLGLGVGSVVVLERKGDVIPKITSVVANPGKIAVPAHCPVCGSPTELFEGEVFVYCSGKSTCPAQLKESLVHFASRRAMDIEGLGDKMVELMVDAKVLTSPADIYLLNMTILTGQLGLGARLSQNLLDGIEQSRTVQLKRFIFALGITGIGETTATLLANQYHSMQNLLTATVDDLVQLRDVGTITAEHVVSYFANTANRATLGALMNVLNIVEPEAVLVNTPFSGKTVVVTGAFTGYGRDELKDRLRSMGATVSSSVSAKTDIVIAGRDAGGKLAKAKDLKLRIMEEAELFTLL